jgi:hypothetical protein
VTAAVAGAPGKILLECGPSERGFHRLEAYWRCGQLFAWGYGGGGSNAERAKRFPPTEPLVRGSIGHAGLAHLYARLQAVQLGEDPGQFYSSTEAMRLVAETFGELGASMLPVAAGAVADYAKHYGTESPRVIGVERPVETLFEGWRYTARIDLEVEDRAGLVWIVDHKILSSVRASAVRRYTLSGQFLGLQHLGMHVHGERFGGVQLNLIGVSPRGFHREVIDPAPWLLTRYPKLVAQAEEGIARLEAERARLGDAFVAPACPSEQVCWTAYGRCPCFELCRWGE